MAEKTADVRLRLIIEAVNNAGQQIQQISKQLSSVAKQAGDVKAAGVAVGAGASGFELWFRRAQDLSPKMEELVRLGTRIKEVGREIGMAGGALFAASAFPIASAAKFERSMNRVRAVTEGTEEDYAKLTSLAEQLGKTTVYSANESAAAMRALGQAGFNTKQIMDSLRATLDLAAAGETSTAEASKYVVNILTQLGLDATNATRVVDNLAAAAAMTTTEVTDLATAFSYAGPAMRSAKMQLEDGASILATFAQVGVEGTRSGTAFRGMVASLGKPTAEAKQAFARLGVQISHNRNGTIDYMKTLKDLRDAGAKEGDWISIFRREYGLLLGLLAENSDMQEQFRKNLENAAGSGRRMADTMVTGVIGSLTQLKNVVLILLSDAGKPLLDWTESIIKQLTDWTAALDSVIKGNTTLTSVLIKTGVILGGLGIAAFALLVTLGTLTKLYGLLKLKVELGVISLAKFAGWIVGLPSSIMTLRASLLAAMAAGSALLPVLATLATIGAIAGVMYAAKAWWDYRKAVEESDAAIEKFAKNAKKAADEMDRLSTADLPKLTPHEEGETAFSDLVTKSNKELEELKKQYVSTFKTAVLQRQIFELEMQKSKEALTTNDAVADGIEQTAIESTAKWKLFTKQIDMAREALVRLLEVEKERREFTLDETRFPHQEMPPEMDEETMKKMQEFRNKTEAMEADLLRDDLARIKARGEAELNQLERDREAKLFGDVEVERRRKVIEGRITQDITDELLKRGDLARSLTLKKVQVTTDIELANLEYLYKAGLMKTEEYLEQRKALVLRKFDAELKELETKLAKAVDPDIKRDLEVEVKVKRTERPGVVAAEDRAAAAQRLEQLEAERNFQRDMAALKMEGLRPEQQRERFDLEMAEIRRQNATKIIEAKRALKLSDNSPEILEMIDAQQAAIAEKERLFREQQLSQQRQFNQDLLQTRLAGTDESDLQSRHDIEMDLLRQQHADKITEMERAGASEKQMIDMAIAQRKEQMLAEANFEKQVLDVRLQGYQDMLASAQSIFSDLYTASNEKVKAFFYVERAVAMAEALVSAYSASAKALDSPFTKLNPMMGMALSKMILIAGLSRAAMIGATALRGPGAWKGGFVDAIRRRHGGPVGWVPKPSPNRFVQAFATGGKVLNQIGRSATPAVREVTRVVGTTVLPHRDPSGLVRGPSGRDVIPAWLTNKEYVLRPEAVAQPGALPFLEAFNRGMITMKDLMASGLQVTRETVIREVHGPARRFATGGLVGGPAAGGAASGSLSVTVPVHVSAGGGMDSKVLVSDLKSGIEETVVRIIKEHM